RQLTNVLRSLTLYEKAAKASEETGEKLREVFDRMRPPMTIQDARAFTIAWLENTRRLTDVLSSIRTFGSECNDLVSGDFEGFMERVRVRKPLAHDFITFFGNNFDSKTGVLDLTKLPTLVRLYGPKIGWKDTDEMTK